jgi:mRNA-decapping enzyme subunit 2
MVAPFIGPLKQWIKQQRKRDKLYGGLNALEPIHVEDSGVGTDLEAMAPELADNDAAEARHFQSLLSRLNKPTTMTQDSELAGDSTQTNELATQLKKLLSVGAPAETSNSTYQPIQASNPPPPVQGTSLMSLLQPSSFSHPPQTPFEQPNATPHQAGTPHYPHPGLPNFDQRAPPPNFPFSPESLNQLHHQVPGGVHLPPGHMTGPVPFQQNMPFPPNQQIPFPHQPHHQQGGIHISGHGPLGPNQPHFIHEAASQPFNPLANQQPPPNVPMHMSGPPASSLPQPKLTAHSLSLLNAFKSPEPATSQVHQSNQHQQSQSAVFVSPQSQPSAKADPATLLRAFGALGAQPQSAPQVQHSHSELEGATVPAHQPKNAQANSLLDLFRRAPSGNSFSDIGSVDHPAELAPPVAELSAGTPQQPRPFDRPMATASSRQLKVKTMVPPSHLRGGQLTSATVSGPLNAPDFESVVRNRPPVELGDGQEHSFTPVPVHSVSPGMPLEAPRAMHHPSILDRQTTPANLPVATPPVQATQSTQPTGLPASFDRRGQAPTDQKTALMSLFGKPTMQAVAAGTSSRQSVFHNTGGVSLTQQRPPSSKSPVSPLPERRLPVKPQQLQQQYTSHPAHPMAKSSRVSSFADESLPSTLGPRSPATPIENKNFLFQYLEDVVKKEGKR